MGLAQTLADHPCNGTPWAHMDPSPRPRGWGACWTGSAAHRTVMVMSSSEPVTEQFQRGWKAPGVVAIAW